MKASHTLAFLLSVFLLIGILWFSFPAEGITIGNANLRFPSYAQARLGEPKKVDIDSVRTSVKQSLEMRISETLLDSLVFYRDYVTTNPNRIYLPNDDYTYFDTLFTLFENAKEDNKLYRVVHYGDSQIEMDRITSVLRQNLQELFGGSGPSMIPPIKRIFSISVNQSYSGGLTRYSLIGDTTSFRPSHNRYGIMTHFAQSSGQATITFSTTKNSDALSKVQDISRVSILFGNNSKGFKVSLKAGDYQGETKTCTSAQTGVSMFTWEMPNNAKKGTLSIQGNAEIYGVMLDGCYGVAVDNVALRGCSGTIFTRINRAMLKESFDITNTKLIILQFGGNRMPSIKGSKSISSYMGELEKQIKYFKEIAPGATILFIGPADMGKKYNGVVGTWKGLPELNDSIKAMALRNDVAYWDMFHVMGGEGSMAQYVKHNPALGSPDHIHFTLRGAQEMGDFLAKSLTNYYDFYTLRKKIPAEDIIEFMGKNNDPDDEEKEEQQTKKEPTKPHNE